MDENELQSIVEDIYSERRNILANWSAPPTHIWFVDTKDVRDAMLDYLYSTTPDPMDPRTLDRIYGIPFGRREPTPDVPQGIWIEDRDGIFHRVR